MKNVNEIVNSSFRFFSLNKLQAFTLERQVSEGSQQKHLKKDGCLGCATLKSDNLKDKFDFFPWKPFTTVLKEKRRIYFTIKKGIGSRNAERYFNSH